MKVVDEMRPRTLEEFKGQEKIVEYTERWLNRMEFPDIIAVGPPGSGKTTWAKIFVSRVFAVNGKPWNIWEVDHPDFKIMNASDERGIDVVRGQIKEFASALPQSAPFRVLVLDEGDKLTGDAQDALRAPVESYSDRCRFIFLGNDETYIDAIKSRCAILRFKSIPNDIAAGYFLDASKKYGVKVSQELANKIADYYEGDLRRMFNDCLEKLIGIDHPVKDEDLDFDASIKGIAIKVMAFLAEGKDPKDAYFQARKYFTSQHAKTKFSLRQFLRVLHEMVGPMSFELAEAFAQADRNIADGGVKEIHVGALLARMAPCLNKSK